MESTRLFFFLSEVQLKMTSFADININTLHMYNYIMSTIRLVLSICSLLSFRNAMAVVHTEGYPSYLCST